MLIWSPLRITVTAVLAESLASPFIYGLGLPGRHEIHVVSPLPFETPFCCGHEVLGGRVARSRCRRFILRFFVNVLSSRRINVRWESSRHQRQQGLLSSEDSTLAKSKYYLIDVVSSGLLAFSMIITEAVLACLMCCTCERGPLNRAEDCFSCCLTSPLARKFSSLFLACVPFPILDTFWTLVRKFLNAPSLA